MRSDGADAEHRRRWLLRTVTNRCLNRLRDQRRRPHLVPIETLPATAEPVAPKSGSDPLAGAHLRRLLLELAPEAGKTQTAAAASAARIVVFPIQLVTVRNQWRLESPRIRLTP